MNGAIRIAQVVIDYQLKAFDQNYLAKLTGIVPNGIRYALNALVTDLQGFVEAILNAVDGVASYGIKRLPSVLMCRSLINAFVFTGNGLFDFGSYNFLFKVSCSFQGTVPKLAFGN